MATRAANSKQGKSTSPQTKFDFDKFKDNATQESVVGALPSSKRDDYKATITLLEEAIRKKDFVLYKQVVKELDKLLASKNKSLVATKDMYKELKDKVEMTKDRGDRFANILLKTDCSTPTSVPESEKKSSAGSQGVTGSKKKGDGSTTSSTSSIPESKGESPTGSFGVTGSKKPLTSKPNDSDTTIVKRLLDIEAIYKQPEKDPKGKRQQPTSKKPPTTDALLDSIERFCNKAVEEKHSLTETNQIMKKRLSQVQRWTVCLGKQVNDRSLNKEELTYTDDDIKCGEMDSILVGLTNIVTEMKDQDEKRKSTEEKHRQLLSLIDTNITLKHNQKEARKDKQDPQVEELDVCISEVEKMYDVLSNWSSKLTDASELVKETTNKLWEDTKAQKSKKTHEPIQIKHPAHCLKCKLDFLETQFKHLDKVCNRNREIVIDTDKEIEELQKEIEEWGANGKIPLFDKSIKCSITAIRSAREKISERKKEKEEKGSSSRIKKIKQLCLENGVKDPKEKNEMDMIGQLEKSLKTERDHQTNLGRLQTMIEDLCKTNDICDATDKDDRYVNMIQQLDTRLKDDRRALKEGLNKLLDTDTNVDSTASKDGKGEIKRLIEIAQTTKRDVEQLKELYSTEQKRLKTCEDDIQRFGKEIEPQMEDIIYNLQGRPNKDHDEHRNQGNLFTTLRDKSVIIKRLSNDALESVTSTIEIILSMPRAQQSKYRSVIGSLNYLNNEAVKDGITREWKGEASYWKDRAIKEENEKNGYMTRLSKIASAKLTNDNPNIADLSDPNRQTKLAEEYSQLYDNEWTNAFEDVEKKPDLNPIDYLRDILTTVYDDCAEIRRLQIKKIKISVLQPAKLLTEINKPPSPEADKDESAKQKTSKQETKKKPKRPLPPTPGPGGQTKELALGELQSKAISEVVKQSYTDALLDINRYFSSSYEAYFTTPHLKAYTTKCIELCWLMNIHSPPVCLGPIAQKGAKFDKNIYRDYTARGTKVEFVVWPAILLHENGPLLGKGVAQGMK